MKMVSGEWGPVQSMPSAAGLFDGGRDDGGVLAAEEVVLAGVGVEAADGDAGWALQHELQGSVAEFDGADDALLVEFAGLFEGDVGGDVYGG